jgi:hypothetical protein
MNEKLPALVKTVIPALLSKYMGGPLVALLIRTGVINSLIDMFIEWQFKDETSEGMDKDRRELMKRENNTAQQISDVSRQVRK